MKNYRTKIHTIARYGISAGVWAFLLMQGCSPVRQGRFPQVLPVHRQDRGSIARARAETYFVKARDYDRRGLDQMAEHFYEMAYELDPDSDILRSVLAQKYVESGKYARALVLLKGERSIEELDPGEKRSAAQYYFRMGQYTKAAEILELLPALSPEESYTLGFIYESMGELERAIERYENWFSEYDESLRAGMKLADVYVRSGRLDDAESLFVDLEERVGEKPEIFNGLAQVKLALGDTALALDFFKTSLMLDSSNQHAMRNIAQLMIQREDFGSAIQYYERLADTNPESIGYGRTLSLLYYYNKEYEKAEMLLKELLSQNIDDYELHFYLGLVFVEQDKLDLARIQLEKTVAARPGFSEGWRQVVYLALRQDDSDRALKYALRYVEQDPDAAEAWHLVGYVYIVRRDYEKAIEPLRKAVGIDSTRARSWFELGSALERTGGRREAMDAFRTVLKFDPDYHAAANYLGYMWAEKGENLDSAKVLLETALKHDPDNGAYLDSYGWIHYQMGNYEEAKEYIEKAAVQIENDPTILDHLGDVLLQLGQPEKALEAYRRCLRNNPTNAEQVNAKIEDLDSAKTSGGGGGQ